MARRASAAATIDTSVRAPKAPGRFLAVLGTVWNWDTLWNQRTGDPQDRTLDLF